jgi:hypothetical protein
VERVEAAVLPIPPLPRYAQPAAARPKLFVLTDYTVPAGRRVTVGRIVADVTVPVFGSLSCAVPDLIFRIVFDGEKLELTPRMLAQYGYFCPAGYICLAKYVFPADVTQCYGPSPDPGSCLATVVVMPNFEIPLRSVSVEFENPLPAPVKVYDARAMFIVYGRMHEMWMEVMR